MPRRAPANLLVPGLAVGFSACAFASGAWHVTLATPVGLPLAALGLGALLVASVADRARRAESARLREQASARLLEDLHRRTTLVLAEAVAAERGLPSPARRAAWAAALARREGMDPQRAARAEVSALLGHVGPCLDPRWNGPSSPAGQPLARGLLGALDLPPRAAEALVHGTHAWLPEGDAADGDEPLLRLLSVSRVLADAEDPDAQVRQLRDGAGRSLDGTLARQVLGDLELLRAEVEAWLLRYPSAEAGELVRRAAREAAEADERALADRVGILLQGHHRVDEGFLALLRQEVDRILPLKGVAVLEGRRAVATGVSLGEARARLAGDGRGLGVHRGHRTVVLVATRPDADPTALDHLAARIGGWLGDLELVCEAAAPAPLSTLVDPVTGLGNRRALEAALAHAESRHRERARSFSVLVVDLGTGDPKTDAAVGDRAARAFGRVLRAVLRGDDTAARSGETRFAVLLPDCGAEGAARVASRLAEASAHTSVSLPSGGIHVLDIRIGAATWPEEAESAVALEEVALGRLVGAALRSGDAATA